MADSEPFKAKTVYDAVSTFEDGMNAGQDPLLLEKSQLSFALNATVRTGFIQPRPPFTNQLAITYSSTAVQTAIEQGLWQGGCYYQPDSGPQSLIASISGNLYQFVINGDTVTVSERTITGNPNPATTTQAWLWQSENYMIVNDGASLPIFFDGATSRRSIGPSVVVGTLTGAPTPATGVPIGDTIVVPLAANWTASYDYPVLYNGEYYQPVLSGGTFQVQLTSLFSNIGEAINVNDTILIRPIIAGVVANPITFTPAAYGYNTTSITITLTAPYTGVLNTALNGYGGKILLFGTVWFVIAKSGNNITVRSGQSGTLPATLASGTQLQYSDGAAPNVNVGTVTVADVAPGILGTVQLTVDTAFTGTPGQIVYLGTGQYTIIGIPQVPPGAASITLINLSDTITTALPTSGDILSVPELPAGRMGAYGLGQNWMCLTDGLSFVASDISRGPSGTTANNRRDSVLKTVDLTFEGGAFSIPGAGNVITSMTFTANLDESLGQGSLQIGTAAFMASCLAPMDFTNPPATGPILTFSLVGTGPLAQNSTVRVNSDIYFRSIFGFGSLIMARRDFTTAGNTPISEEVRDRLLELDDQELLPYGSSIQFDNRWLHTLSPQASSQGVLHAGLVAMNLDPVSGVRGKRPPVYDGLWTGINVLQLLAGNFNGRERSFAFTFNTSLSKIELYELLPTLPDNRFDNGNIPITWSFETASLFKNKAPDGTLLSLRNGEFSVKDLLGTVRFEVFYKADQGCWTPWHSFSICADLDGEPQYFPRLGLGEPDSTDCDPILNYPLRDGLTFQIKFQITGSCKFIGARFSAVTIPGPKFLPATCDVITTVTP